MKAELLPLKGKYLGTRILLTFDDCGDPSEVVIWDQDDHTPSEREISGRGLSGTQDSELMQYFTHPHYENVTSLNRAKQIIYAIDKPDVA